MFFSLSAYFRRNEIRQPKVSGLPYFENRESCKVAGCGLRFELMVQKMKETFYWVIQ